jgi:hypothetical protein
MPAFMSVVAVDQAHAFEVDSSGTISENLVQVGRPSFPGVAANLLSIFGLFLFGSPSNITSFGVGCTSRAALKAQTTQGHYPFVSNYSAYANNNHGMDRRPQRETRLSREPRGPLTR